MKKQLDIKKLVLLNLPYLLMGLFATNFGEAWRMAQGANASEKFLSLFAVLPGALQSFWPSLHPLDLLVGLCCGAGLRLAVYLKSKNAKKYRHGMEYGSARWGTREDIAPYIDPVFQNNVETDLSFQNILWFAQQAILGGLSMENVEFVTMPNRTASCWSRTYHNYQSYVVPSADELLELVNTKLSPYTEVFVDE